MGLERLQWGALGPKPMSFGEYGADLFNGLTNKYDPESQAIATMRLE
jgi:hypothetical protein